MPSHLEMLGPTNFHYQSVMKCQGHNVHSLHPDEGPAGSTGPSWESWKQVLL